MSNIVLDVFDVKNKYTTMSNEVVLVTLYLYSFIAYSSLHHSVAFLKIGIMYRSEPRILHCSRIT